MRIPKVSMWLLAFSWCAFAGVAGAAPTNFPGVGVVQDAVWTISPLPGSRDMRIRIVCSGVSVVQVAGGYSLRIPGQASSAKPGTPDVPRLARLVPGIDGMRAVLKLQGSDPTNVTDVIVAPAVGYRLNDPESPMRELQSYRQPDPDIYSKDQFWPRELGTVEEAWMGSQKVVRVECFPVQYSPLTRTFRLFRRLEGEMRFESEP